MRGRPRKLTPDQVETIRHLYQHSTQSMADLARMFRVSEPTIARAIEGK